MNATEFTAPTTGARFVRKGNGRCYRFGMPESEQEQAIKRNGMAYYRISRREFETAELFFAHKAVSHIKEVQAQ